MSLPTEPLTHESAERDPHSPDVLRMLLDNHARFLGFLERRVGSRDEAEDILQEAFVRSIGRTDSLRSPESATAWFYRVLRNALIDHHRREGTRARAFDQLAADAGEETDAPDQELEAVACACITVLVDTLKPEMGRRFAVSIWTASACVPLPRRRGSRLGTLRSGCTAPVRHFVANLPGVVAPA